MLLLRAPVWKGHLALPRRPDLLDDLPHQAIETLAELVQKIPSVERGFGYPGVSHLRTDRVCTPSALANSDMESPQASRFALKSAFPLTLAPEVSSCCNAAMKERCNDNDATLQRPGMQQVLSKALLPRDIP